MSKKKTLYSALVLSIAAISVGYVLTFDKERAYANDFIGCIQDSPSGSELDIECTKMVTKRLLSNTDTRTVMTALTASSTNTVIRSHCHTIGHIVGQNTFTQLGSIDESIKACTRSCMSACVHGVVGAAAQSALNVSTSEELEHADVAAVKELSQRECGQGAVRCHAMGHLLLIAIEDHVEASKICEEVSPDISGVESCYQGVFMELMSSRDGLFPGRIDSSSNTPEFSTICENISDSATRSCYLYLPQLMEESFIEDRVNNPRTRIEIATTFCEKLPRRERSECFIGFGFWSGNGRIFDLRIIGEQNNRICDLMPAEPDKNSCTIGFSRLLSATNPRIAFAFCNSINETNRQQLCYNTVLQSYDILDSTMESLTATCEESDTYNCAGIVERYWNIRETLPDYRYTVQSDPF